MSSRRGGMPRTKSSTSRGSPGRTPAGAAARNFGAVHSVSVLVYARVTSLKARRSTPCEMLRVVERWLAEF
jgi:hypothetical protein